MPVSVYIRTKNPAGQWRYSRVQTGKGKKTGALMPPFYIRPRRDGKQVWLPLTACTFGDALKEADETSMEMEARPEVDSNRTTLVAAVERFLTNAQAAKKRKTMLGYRLNLSQFLDSAATKVTFLDQVNGDTIRAFRDSLRENEYDARTQHNRVITVLHDS